MNNRYNAPDGNLFKGETLRGKIINLNEANPERDPIAKPDEHEDLGQPPNAALTKGFDKDELELGDRVEFYVYNTEPSLIFGQKVEDDEEPEPEGDYRLSFYVAGNRFESEALDSKRQAESVRDALQALYDIDAEVERKR